MNSLRPGGFEKARPMRVLQPPYHRIQTRLFSWGRKLLGDQNFKNSLIIIWRSAAGLKEKLLPLSGEAGKFTPPKAAEDRWPQCPSPASTGRRPQIADNFLKRKRFFLRLQQVHYRAGREKNSASFGGVNLALLRACSGFPYFPVPELFPTFGEGEGGGC
jgi:hypothetical protein